MTRRRTPTPEELVAWAAVAHPAAARGTYRWHTDRAEVADGIGWFAFAGEVPAPLHVPPDTDVAFWYEAPGRWRLEVDGVLAGVADGNQAVARTSDHVHAGSRLLAPGGPARLLQPEPEDEPYGEVAADVQLGRACWRWTSPAATWWLDHETGVALAYEDADLRAELLTLELTAAGADFTVPPDLIAQGRPLVDPPFEDGCEVEQDRAHWQPEFTVTWWPGGTLCWPDSGDPDVPEVLLVLGTVEPMHVWLGVAPLPRPAPVKARARTHRWTGDGWSFALSWRGELTPADVERVAASVPLQWAP